MAANVTEKDKALQEVIAWCDSRFDKACQYFSAASSGELAAQYLVAIYAYRGVIAHCRSMLGSGSMPSEVPNQSEDEMTITELHDYCRYLFDENHVHGVPDKWSEGYEFALSLVMFKCHEGLTDEDRKAVAEWREKHWKDAE